MTDHEPIKLPGAVDDIDALPENQRPFYAKSDDGKYRLSVQPTEDGWAFSNVGGMRSALEKEKETRRKLVEKLGQFEGIAEKLGDHDVDDLLSTFERVKTGKLTGSDEIETAKASLKKQMEQKLADVTQEKDGRITKLTGELQRRLIDMEAVSACASLGAKAKLLLPHIRERCEVREVDGGQFEAVVLNAQGEPRVSGKGDQTYMTIEEFVSEEMKNDPEFAPAFGQAQGGNLRERFGGGRGGDAASRAKPGEDRFMQARRRKFGTGR